MPADPAPDVPADASGPVRLLVADDDRFIRSMLTTALSGEFELVGAAADADEAIALADQHRPDAVIVDVDMPGGGGLRATREIASRLPGTAIVVLSGDESDVVVREVINAGAATYVRKGASRAELAQAVHRSVAATRAGA